MKKRILSLILTIALFVCLLPQTVFHAEASITVFSQTDSRWGNHQYGYRNTAGTNPATISSGGCGILALVNAVYYMNGNFIDPITLADWSVSNGYRVNGVGTSHGLYPAYSKAYGSTYGFSCNSSTGTNSWDTLVAHLQNGGTAIVPVTTIATGSGHLLVIADYNASNSTYLVLDSYASYNRGTSSGYAWMTKSQFQSKMSNSIFILINNISGSSSHSTHSFSGSYYEAAHPHKEYQMCSCGATKYTGATKTVSTCETCNPVSTSTKYNAVLPFKAYLKGTSTVYPYSTVHLSGSTSGEIWSTDECTISAVYSNGACKVTYPVGSGTKTAYTSLSNFIGNTSASLTKQTINHEVTTYIRASTSSTKYGYTEPGDVIYTMGTSGSMTQIFYPTSSGYKLAWVLTSELKEPTYDTRFNPYCPIKGYICATSTINAYASDYTTDIGDIWTTDFCYINAVYADGWCNVTYPVGSGTKTGYVRLGFFVYNPSASHVKYTAKAQTTVYHTKDLAYIVSADQPWYISAGDVFYVISTYGSASQVLYPVDAQYGGGYKIGWIYTSALPKTTYTVSYNANGGTGAPASQTKTHGVALTLSTTTPTRTGYAFVGWATSSSATSATYAPGASYATDANLTLYAVWTLNKYEITYDANGGTNAPTTQNKAHGTALTLSSTIPQKHFTVTFNANGGTVDVANRQVDCTFLGWSTSASSTSASYQPGASFTTNANTTLYAVWKNNALAQYDFPVRNGYVFDGWYTAASGGTQVTSETVVDKNMTLYAHWSLATYTVYYDANGGTGAPAEQTKTHGKALTLSTVVPTRKNYTFLGWGTEESDATVQYQPGGTYTADSDIMLIAVWKFNLSPTISVGTVSAKADDTITVPVSIADNPGISTFTLGFDYDTSRLKLKSVTVNPALGGQFAYNTKAVWLGSGDTEYVGEILTLTFDVLTTATKGDAYVTVTYNTGDISNYNEENVAFAISAGKVTVTQAHVHSYSYKVTTNPTTSATGKLTGTCSVCSGTTTVTLPKLNTTDYNYSVVKAATCTATGTGRYTWKTTAYGSFYFDVTIAKTSHNYASTVTAPTCTAQGYTTHTCSGCGDSYKDTYTAALGHNYSYKVTTAPTTSATGKLTGTCSRCSGTTTVTLPKLNTTDYTYKVTKAATCTATGTGRYTWKTTTYGSFYFDVTIAKTSHNYASTVTAPTCTAQGYTTHTCSACGDSYKDTYTAALGHSYSYKVTTNPTTSATGKLTGTCSVCSGTTTVTLPKLNTTDYSYSVVKAATCTATGTGRYTWKTTTYGSFYFDVTIAKTSHNYVATVTAPTCTAQGYTTHTCSGCGDSYKDTYTAALGHNYSYKVTTAPTTSATGKLTGTCSRCSGTTTVTLPKLNTTDYTYKVTKAATCTATGTGRYTWKTTTYGSFYFDVTIAKTSHNYASTVTAPTCTAQGYTTHTCSACGDSYKDSYTTALGHEESDWIIDTQSTCVASGSKHTECVRCSVTLQTEVTSPSGHTEGGWITDSAPSCTSSGSQHTECLVCGATLQTKSVSALGHDYASEVTAATCTEQGYTLHTCSRCGDSYTESYTTPLGHDWDEGMVTKEPTETEAGERTYTCSRCGENKTEAIPALGHTHSYTETVITPTCTEQGYTLHICSCGDSYKDRYTDALGHAWDGGTVTAPPTATETGVKTYSCTRCAEMRMEVIPATGGEEQKPCDGGANCPSAKFRDVKASDWFHEYVDFAVSNGLFGGMSDTTFEPNTAMTRAMLVTVLWRYAGQPIEGENIFTDVPSGQWYTSAVAWAAANGIVGGVGNNKFDPNGNITREQMAAILYRYAQKLGLDTSARADLSGFPDGGKVSAYAKDAIRWAVAEGLINGSDGKLLPQGNATRAQVAAILMRFIENVVS